MFLCQQLNRCFCRGCSRNSIGGGWCRGWRRYQADGGVSCGGEGWAVEFNWESKLSGLFRALSNPRTSFQFVYSCQVMLRRLAPSRLAPLKLALSRLAPERLAPSRFALSRFAPERLAPKRLAPEI